MTTNELVQELRGVKCQCGAKKQPRKTFCGACYYSLTVTQQRALYRLVGNGYEEAYANAIKSLRGE